MVWFTVKVGHTRFPVINEYGKLVGIVTARDVFSRKIKESTMRDVMERDILTTKLDDPVSSVGILCYLKV